MKNLLLFLAIAVVGCVAFFAPFVYLIGTMTSVIPTYIYLLKPSIKKAEEDGEGFPLSTRVLEGEGFFVHKVRQFLVLLIWVLVCSLMWWALLLISMSKNFTEVFIDGFSKGVK